MRLFLASLALACTGCSALQPSGAVVAPNRDWRAVATGADRERLAQWRDAFTAGLAAARAGGYASQVEDEGVLLDPDAAIGGGIANGAYRCRVIKLGAQSPGVPDFVAYPAFHCRVRQHGAVQDFRKLDGLQRHVGLIFPDGSLRQVFLGTLVVGDEQRAMHYGVDPERDVAGFVERIGPDRWRLIMPRPHFESTIDIMELLPESGRTEGGVYQ